MKTITLASWCLLGLYAAILLGLLLFARAGSSSDRMASGYLMLLFVPLFILAGINLLPYKFTHIFVLVMCVAPVVMGVLMLIASPIVQGVRERMWASQDVAEANGSYYFKDEARRKLAADIASLDTEKLKADLQEPVPALNETGREQLTIFDFAAKQGRTADSTKLIECFALLLKNGAKIDNGDPQHSPTHFRVLDYNPLFLKWFLENGADANARTADQKLPIIYLAINGENSEPARQAKLEKVRLLLEHGADPNAEIPKVDDLVIATSTLMTAGDMELWTICNLLIDAGADIHFRRSPDSWDFVEAMAYKLKEHGAREASLPEDLTLLAKRLNLPVASDTPQ